MMAFIGFTIWFIFSAILVGATLWSAGILMQQKRAWAAFAKKHGMVYEKGRILSSPTISGSIENFRVSFFAAERQALDVRQRKMLTGLEISFPRGLIDGAAVGSEEMVPFMNALSALHPMTPDSAQWDKSLKMYVRDDAAMKAWLTDDRLSHVVAIAGTKNSDNIFIFDSTQAVIRLETRDPLTDPDKMEKAVQRLIKHAKALLAS